MLTPLISLLKRLSPLFTIALLLSACTTQKLDKNGVNHVDLVKKTQRVIRYNCSGQVASDGIETVDKPEQWVTIPSNDDYVTKDVNFFNNTTADGADLYAGLNTFLVQYHQRDWGMSVNEGTNSIHYTFYSCADKMSNECANHYQVAETGDLTLEVTYKEEFLSGVKTVSSDECGTSPNPHP